MKNKFEFTKNNYHHLCEFTHFLDEFKEKPLCDHYLKCTAFVRSENGQNKLEDFCHLKLYKHPPRNQRQIKLENNVNAFIINTEKKENKRVEDFFLLLYHHIPHIPSHWEGGRCSAHHGTKTGNEGPLEKPLPPCGVAWRRGGT